MSMLNTVLASLPGGVEVKLGSLLRRLHLQGQLEPLVREALVAQLLNTQARAVGLAATLPELQTAADAFRRRHGLNSAAETHAWLRRQRLSVVDFESALEQDLLTDRLRQSIPDARVEARFNAEKAGYDSLRLARVVVPREDLANEMLSQIREDGRELDDVAKEHQLDVVRLQVYRCQLSEPQAYTKVGQIVGPVASEQGFAIFVVEEIKPAELDPDTKSRIQQELFDRWMHARLKDAVVDLGIVGAS